MQNVFEIEVHGVINAIERQYGEHVRALLRRAFASESDVLLEEAWQSVLLSLWERMIAGTQPIEVPGRGLLVKWAVRKVRWNMQMKYKHVSGWECVQLFSQIASGQEQFDMELREVEVAEGSVGAQIVEALEKLSERQRDAFELRHVQGLSRVRAGELMGISTNDADQAAYHGRRRLRKLLAPLQAAG